MDRLLAGLFGFAGATTRLGGIASQMLHDRLKLLALELLETKIRAIQAFLLSCLGVIFALLGLLLLVITGIYALPSEWRIIGLMVSAVASLVTGILLFATLFRILSRPPLPFEQSIAELKKDAECFSTKN